MTKKTFYEKVGRRYVPVKEYDSDVMDAFPHGSHLVVVNMRGSTRTYHVDPQHAAAYAAFTDAENAISREIMNALKLRPSKEILTEEQSRAWKALTEAFGDQVFPLQWPSVHEAVIAGKKALADKMQAKMNNPVVKQAYEQFLVIYALGE